MRYLAIRRDDRYSPNSVAKDREILVDVCHEIERAELLSHPIEIVDESQLDVANHSEDCFISMARSPESLRTLADAATQGRFVINDPLGVMNCRRSLLNRIMRENHIAMPPETGKHGYWLKRGDAAAQSKDDVVYCRDRSALDEAKAVFGQRGIVDYVVSTHVVGDLVKFYGVGHRMFHYFYPSEDGISKFGDEIIFGQAHHYSFSEIALRDEVQRLADTTHVAIYGGDAIIREDGSFCIIDFNDWPSFYRCKEEAAKAIAEEIIVREIPYLD